MGSSLNSFSRIRTKITFIACLQDSAFTVQLSQQTSNMSEESCEWFHYDHYHLPNEHRPCQTRALNLENDIRKILMLRSVFVSWHHCHFYHHHFMVDFLGNPNARWLFASRCFDRMKLLLPWASTRLYKLYIPYTINILYIHVLLLHYWILFMNISMPLRALRPSSPASSLKDCGSPLPDHTSDMPWLCMFCIVLCLKFLKSSTEPI